jgi:hypothetical protein
MAASDDREIAYYRAVEDLFANLRGVPHVLSPKDFQLLREWWRNDVPLTVIRTAVTEVFARRRERGDAGPIVSLSYCRHAVSEHARRHAEMQVGASGGPQPDTVSTSTAIGRLASSLERASEDLLGPRPRAAEVVSRLATGVRGAGELPAAVVEEYLYALETNLLDACLDTLEPDERATLESRARQQAERITEDPDARQRTFRALRDRLLRDLLGLPRLELEV